jgi:transcriptional regulator with XRE-family HTH domain
MTAAKVRKDPAADAEIGRRIRAARLERNPPISGATLAAHLDISRQALQKIETGEISLRSSYIELVANLLDVMIYDLVAELPRTDRSTTHHNAPTRTTH